jgi:hypothetical protein
MATCSDVVRDALNATGSFEAYHGRGPESPQTAAPYWVVYSGLVTGDGPVNRPWSDLYSEVQVTSVGLEAEQAEYLANAACNALLNGDLPPPSGRAWLRPGSPCGLVITRPVERDDDFGEGLPLFYVVSVFDVPSTPA